MVSKTNAGGLKPGPGPRDTGAGTTGAATTGAATTNGRRSGGGRPSTTMHLRVDLAALRRGELNDGEVCEIPGVGPVPLATARNVLGESFLKVIIEDGVDVTSVDSATGTIT
jgi:hypothetical protein